MKIADEEREARTGGSDQDPPGRRAQHLAAHEQHGAPGGPPSPWVSKEPARSTTHREARTRHRVMQRPQCADGSPYCLIARRRSGSTPPLAPWRSPSRPGCDRADVVAQFPGRYVDVVVLDACLHVWVVHAEGDGDLVRSIADEDRVSARLRRWDPEWPRPVRRTRSAIGAAATRRHRRPGEPGWGVRDAARIRLIEQVTPTRLINGAHAPARLAEPAVMGLSPREPHQFGGHRIERGSWPPRREISRGQPKDRPRQRPGSDTTLRRTSRARRHRCAPSCPRSRRQGRRSGRRNRARPAPPIEHRWSWMPHRRPSARRRRLRQTSAWQELRGRGWPE